MKVLVWILMVSLGAYAQSETQTPPPSEPQGTAGQVGAPTSIFNQPSGPHS